VGAHELPHAEAFSCAAVRQSLVVGAEQVHAADDRLHGRGIDLLRP
jgi:hypothetical protein